jgi:tungstate transport system substrate-binding protein
MRSFAIAATLVVSAALACGRRPAERPLRFGTTTTVQQSGMLALAESLWTGPRLAPVIGPSGQILQAAAQGDLEVVLTHAPALEAKLLAGMSGLERCPFDQPVRDRRSARRRGQDRAAPQRRHRDAAHRRATASFVSRGDASGTHEREMCSGVAGIEPAGQPWYIESGADQTTTLRIADERRAYALADVPTFGRISGLALRPLFVADSALVNRYTLYVVAARTSHPAVRPFFAWALGTWRPQVLALRLPDGGPAFEPAPGACTISSRSPSSP